MYKLLSLLLIYPSQEWLEDLGSMQEYAHSKVNDAAKLDALFEELQSQSLIELQENYVTVFDRNKSHSLHLFEHLYGEDRERGQAMVDLLHEYQKEGLEPHGHELPDYLPLFIEFLSIVDEKKALELLGDAVHVIHYIAGNLQKNGSRYGDVLAYLVSLSPVQPEALKVAPIRDMDEAMEMFGPSVEGVEPLMSPTCNMLNKPTKPQTIAVNLNDIKHHE